MIIIFNSLIDILRKLPYDEMTLPSLKFLIGKLDEIQFPDPNGDDAEPGEGMENFYLKIVSRNI